MSVTGTEGTSVPASVAPVCNPWVSVGWYPTHVAWTPGVMAVNLDGGERPTGERDQERRLGAEVRAPRPRLGRRKFAASLGPHPACRKTGASQGARRPRERRCLLKGCEKHFRPTHPQARYCSPECRAAARRWRRRRASRQYRRTANGQEKRRAQSRRYRCRCASGGERPSRRGPTSAAPDTACPCAMPRARASAQPASPIFCCDRPGCEEHFGPRIAARASGFAARLAVRRCVA